MRGPAPVIGTTGSNGALGRDSAFPLAGGRLGDGMWDFDDYWEAHYGTTPKPAALQGYSTTNPPTRYDVYRAEIASIGTGATNDLVAHANANQEVGAPMCYSGGTPSSTPDRRVLYVAIINCSQLDVHGNTDTNLPVAAFGKFFLTEPIPKSPAPEAGTIFAELIDLAEPGNASASNDITHDLVQLYR
ncbi:MAG: hypothetical protein ACK5JT_03660 [Hyphomicrobiaceae bacterium]